MNVLAIETSTKRLCLGVINHKGKIVEYNLDSEIRHAELLLPTLKKALKRLSLVLSELDYFAVGLGPGSFTGLRIGLAMVKGFTEAVGVPVVGFSSLDILASNALPAKSKIICPLIDAKRNLLFTALYEVGFNNKLKRRSPYLLINIEELLKRFPSNKLVTFLGDGLSLYQQTIKQRMRNSIFLNEDTWYPRARNLIKLSLDLINKGRFTPLERKRKSKDKFNFLTGFSDAARIKPIYLYPKECQIKKSNIKN